MKMFEMFFEFVFLVLFIFNVVSTLYILCCRKFLKIIAKFVVENREVWSEWTFALFLIL